jgi:hypothetical protein
VESVNMGLQVGSGVIGFGLHGFRDEGRSESSSFPGIFGVPSDFVFSSPAALIANRDKYLEIGL